MSPNQDNRTENRQGCNHVHAYQGSCVRLAGHAGDHRWRYPDRLGKGQIDTPVNERVIADEFEEEQTLP